MPDPIIPGIPDERAREIAKELQTHSRMSRWTFNDRPDLGRSGWYDEWFCLQRAKLVNANGYSTSAGRRLWEKLNAQD